MHDKLDSKEKKLKEKAKLLKRLKYVLQQSAVRPR
jgi:hypothetical protein